MRTLFLIPALFFTTVTPLTDSNFDKHVTKKKDKIVVVDFGADWCGPCRTLKPVFKQVAKENRDLDFYSVDVDTQMSLTMRYGVASIPTILVFHDGKVLSRHTGSANSAQIAQIIKVAKEAVEQ